MIHIFMHEDADGYAAGYQVAKYYNEGFPTINNKIKFHVMNYSTEFPINEINSDDIVYIVDFSIEPDMMIKLLKVTEDVIWIDHHVSAIKKYDDWYQLIEEATGVDYIDGLRVVGLSGCALTWIFLNLDISEIHKYQYKKEEDFVLNLKQNFGFAPIWLRLINDWDVWEHNIPETKPFMTCLSTQLSITKMQLLDIDAYEETPLGKCQIDDIDRTDLLKRIIDLGKAYIEYRTAWSKQLRDKYGFETNIIGPDKKSYSMFVLNVGNANSEYFGDYIDKYDIVSTFCFDGIKYNYSMYSNKDFVDCAELCRYFGEDNGGGHKGAAGFTHKNLLFHK